MYRLLIATNEPDVLDKLNASVDWASLNFRQPMVVGTAEEAIQSMETQRVDCIAYMLSSDEARRLSNYLNNVRPSLPIFEIRRSVEAQMRILNDMRRVLDRLHEDSSDEVIDEKTVMSMLRDELMHNLLAGEISGEKELRGRMQMLRSHLSLTRPCVLYEFDMPQGEVYLNFQWHYGSERLEKALRNNFFGRYYEDIYYQVAALTPRQIRLIACQREDRENEPEDSLVERADQHVSQVLDQIKEYLGLDMVLNQRVVLPNMIVLTEAQ
ncbi:MAG: hypothetical protein IJ157_14220 [Clostridia bacterium]|nr:hypothetical protein [Clostridia bacterium]